MIIYNTFIKFLHVTLKCVLIGCIRFYQLILSPAKRALFGAHSGCRFYPTCSAYSKESIINHGIAKGLLLSFKRIIKCHPFSKGGFDPLPKQ